MIDLCLEFQSAEDVARETLIKNHFTQRIAELTSKVKRKTRKGEIDSAKILVGVLALRHLVSSSINRICCC